jgi:hypothetical protein
VLPFFKTCFKIGRLSFTGALQDLKQKIIRRRTGTKPEKVDLTKVVIDTTDEQDPVVTDSVDVRLLINMIRLIRLGSSPPSPLPMREHKYRNRASVLQGTCL